MNRSGFTARSSVAGVLATAAASGLVLAGCGNSSGSSAASTSGSGSASGQPAGSASASAAASSGSGGNASTISAGFFPLAVGNKWVYVVKGGGHGTVTNKVISLTPAGGGTKAIMKVMELLDGSPTTTTSALIVHSDGSISVPVTELGNSFKIKSGSVIWPSAAQLASGQAHHDTLVISMNLGGQSTTVRAHVVVKGEGTHTIRVPAGTYQATLIDETMTEKFSGVAVGLDIRTWVANGVGPVKDEVTSGAGGKSAISIVEELKSFTKG